MYALLVYALYGEDVLKGGEMTSFRGQPRQVRGGIAGRAILSEEPIGLRKGGNVGSEGACAFANVHSRRIRRFPFFFGIHYLERKRIH